MDGNANIERRTPTIGVDYDDCANYAHENNIPLHLMVTCDIAVKTMTEAEISNANKTPSMQIEINKAKLSLLDTVESFSTVEETDA